MISHWVYFPTLLILGVDMSFGFAKWNEQKGQDFSSEPRI